MWTRELKPGFWRNECLGGLPCYARLTAVGLPGLADREGRLENRPGKIKGELFPFDADVTAADVEVWLGMLESIDFIRRYSVDGVGVIAITNFHKHQHIHPRERPSTLPGISENSRELPDEPGKGSLFRAALSSLSSLSALTDKSFTPAGAVVGSLASASNPPQSINGSKPNGTKAERTHVAQVVDLYNEIMAPPFRACKIVTPGRRAAIGQRIANELPTLEHWRNYFAYVKQMPFLMGREAPRPPYTKPFRGSLDWLCKPANYAKVLEDTYVK
jgi:hypothetical protein